MATLQQIRKKVVSVDVNLDGEIIHTEMVPYAQGQSEAEAWLKKLNDEEDNAEATALFFERFFATFKSWDLEDESQPVMEADNGSEPRQKTNPATGKPLFQIIPLTVDGFKQADIDVRLLAAFMVRAYEAHAAKKAPNVRR